jgi:hypothetical protein
VQREECRGRERQIGEEEEEEEGYKKRGRGED